MDVSMQKRGEPIIFPGAFRYVGAPLFFVDRADSHLLDNAPLDGRLVVAADLDGDGAVDLIQGASDGLRIYHNQGDGTADLVLTTVASPTGEFLRVLLNRRTVDADDPSVLRFVQEPVLSPLDPVSFSAVLDMESDGDMNLLLHTQGQNRVFINDGNAHFFDDTTSTLPVDRTDSLRAVTGDLNLDGFTDVVIANYGQADRLYLESAEGRMLDFTASLGLEVASTRFAVILDADGDNVPDKQARRATEALAGQGASEQLAQRT